MYTHIMMAQTIPEDEDDFNEFLDVLKIGAVMWLGVLFLHRHPRVGALHQENY